MSVCRCTDTEVCFPCRDREAHPAPEPVTADDPALLVPGSEWRDPEAVAGPDDWPTAAELIRRQALREAAYPPPAEAPVYAIDERHDRFPRVAGRCPSCAGESLFLAVGGHVRCSRLDCEESSAVDDLLRGRAVLLYTRLGYEQANGGGDDA